MNDSLNLPPVHHTGPTGPCCSFSVGERAGPSVHVVTFEGAPSQIPWAHTPPYHCPHLGLVLCSPHTFQLRSEGLLCANPNARLDPMGPFPRGLVPQSWGLGMAKPQCQIHPFAKLPHR